jgi:sigma-B regulation protein RsbU (phosphoserine phosphatase)
MGVMPTGIADPRLKDELLERRRRLETAAPALPDQAEQVSRLLREVDDALRRFESGDYGLCDVCHDTVEVPRLFADPLSRTCLDHLSREEQQALERDLDLASRVQDELLPRRNVAHDGWEVAFHYEPAGAVSGDYCDLVSSPERGGDLFLLLGDVAGKGVAASLQMAGLRAIVRTLVDAGLPLAELADRANRLFCESTLPSHFATLVLARARPTGEIEFCNAGHPPPLLIRAGGVEKIPATSLPLGMFCTTGYRVVSVRMQPGESLLLYSDGLSEARDPAGREYGQDRVAEIAGRVHGLAPRALIDACMKDLGTFRSNAARADDLTLMAVRRSF